MVAVAVVGVLLAYRERWRRYERMAKYHDGMVWRDYGGMPPRIIFSWPVDYDPVSKFHDLKAQEYRRAARFPWIGVKLEPPPCLTPVDTR